MPKITIHTSGTVKQVDFEVGQSLLTLLRHEGETVIAPCGGKGTCGKCTIDVKEFGMVTSCIYFPKDNLEVYLPRPRESKILTDQHDYTLAISLNIGACSVLLKNPLGVAIDIGTTSLAIYIVDLCTGYILGVAATLNSQSKFGADVISRIDYCNENEGGLKELQNAVLNDISEKINEKCLSLGIQSESIVKMSVAGNTTMLHLLLGEDPKSIAFAPFTPKFLTSKHVLAKALGFNFHSQAEVHIMPGISAYVGADIVSGLAALNPPSKISKYLFVDVGTNGEMALVTPDKIWSCATAAGPAFEGANISCGMGAFAGAISAFSSGGAITINDEKAIGICGSGLIDAVAYMLNTRVIGFDGNLENNFILVNGAESGNAKDIVLMPKDISEVQLAKSAIYTGINVLLEKANLDFSDIDALFLAGGFGNYLNIESAIRIGVLPKEISTKIVQIGNTSGAGAVLDVCSIDFVKRLEEVIVKSEHIDLSQEDSFSLNYVMNMFF